MLDLRDLGPRRPHDITPAVFERIEVVVNPASGSVGPGAVADMEAILAEAGRKARVVAPTPPDMGQALQAAVDSRPDVVIVLAGDGTARAAASLCGPEGPLLAPLAGGTMNMLPHAIYGRRPWQEALRDILRGGVVRSVGGGRVGEHNFYVGAILGAPALWGEAREAVRKGQIRRAIEGARYAWRRAFSDQLRYSLENGPRQTAEAINVLCPLVSKALPDEAQALEVDALDPKGATDAFRLGFRALLSEFHGDWRDDPSVTAKPCRTARIWGHSHMPALLDGEPVRLPRHVTLEFVPGAFRALAPAGHDQVEV